MHNKRIKLLRRVNPNQTWGILGVPSDKFLYYFKEFLDLHGDLGKWAFFVDQKPVEISKMKVISFNHL